MSGATATVAGSMPSARAFARSGPLNEAMRTAFRKIPDRYEWKCTYRPEVLGRAMDGLV